MRVRWLFTLLVSLLTLPARPARAQNAGLTTNRNYQLKYQVPAGWQPTRLLSDSLSVLRYDSPDGTTRLWVGQLRGPAGQVPPARALRKLLRRLGATRHHEHHVSAHGLDLLESTGTCLVDGRTLRYDARVGVHQGHTVVSMPRPKTSPCRSRCSIRYSTASRPCPAGRLRNSS